MLLLHNKDQPQKNPLPSSARNGAEVQLQGRYCMTPDREPGPCVV